MISEGCILNGMYARNSIIGLRSRIDENTTIENSIVMGADIFESFEEIKQNVSRGKPHIGIGQNSVVRRAIIDKNARIGSNVRLINQHNVETAEAENGCWFIREGIIIVPKTAMIPDGTVI
jgi:glucose-1-phosphate adenylyltransferase